ncbi:MAG: uracil-DNA glycosylase [Syntrophobacteraceae bacterium]
MDDSTKAARLEDLYLRIRRDAGYRNNRMAEVFVPGSGSLGGNPVVLIGEAPGRNEEMARRPFVGAAGKNLDILLGHAGLSREQIFITNVIKYRPVSPEGKNRSPSARESKNALPYLLEELGILSPGLAVCLGLCPARTLLGGTPVMGEMNGKVYQGFGMDIMVSYHPSPFNFMIAKKREEMIRTFGVLRGIVNNEGDYFSRKAPSF